MQVQCNNPRSLALDFYKPSAHTSRMHHVTGRSHRNTRSQMSTYYRPNVRQRRSEGHGVAVGNGVHSVYPGVCLLQLMELSSQPLSPLLYLQRPRSLRGEMKLFSYSCFAIDNGVRC